MAIKVTSPAFKPSGLIPSQYTCDGADFSPPLAWSGAPSNTKSIAMIVDDPDAPDPAKPQRVYVHWVVYNLPPNTAALPENASKKGLPKGAVQGKNDWGKSRVWWAMSANRTASLLLQALRTRHGVDGIVSPDKGRSRASDERARHRLRRACWDLSEVGE